MKFVKYALLLAVTVLTFATANRLLAPKYMTQALEGRLTPEYYLSAKNHSVIFLGDCEVFNTFSPPALWRSHGIPSFVRGGPQQLLWHSYYLLRDTLRFEVPDVVVLSVLAMRYGEPMLEEYNRMNLEGMRASRTKLNAVRASAFPDENILSYFFHILRYNERWRSLEREDFYYFWRQNRVSHNGFMMRADIMPVDFDNFIPGLRLADYSFPPKAWEYLDRIRLLCEEYGIDLVLIKAPTIFPYWHRRWDDQIAEYAERHGLLYVNSLDLADEIGMDFSTDTFNGGFHLNVYGAERVTKFLGEILVNEFNLADRRAWPTEPDTPGTRRFSTPIWPVNRRADVEMTAAWELKLAAYDSMKAAQEREFAETGRVRTLTFVHER